MQNRAEDEALKQARADMPCDPGAGRRTRDGVHSMIVMTISIGSSAQPRINGIRLLHMAALLRSQRRAHLRLGDRRGKIGGLRTQVASIGRYGREPEIVPVRGNREPVSVPMSKVSPLIENRNGTVRSTRPSATSVPSTRSDTEAPLPSPPPS